MFPRRDGDPWRETDYRNWRKRIYKPAAKAAGTPKPRRYDLRHSFVSLLVAEGVNIVEVAAQTGNSPMVALDVYGRVIEEFAGQKVDAEKTILAAKNFPHGSRDVMDATAP